MSPSLICARPRLMESRGGGWRRNLSFGWDGDASLAPPPTLRRPAHRETTTSGARRLCGSRWLGARLARCASDLPWSEDANSGMSKLLGGLPTKKARALRALCRRVIVGQPASAHIRAGAAATPRELLSLFEAAFSNGVGLGFVYSDREGRQSQRRVEPHGLLVEPPVWYVLSRDVDKGEPRTFRMDRISRPRILANILFRPDITVIQAQLPDQDRWRPLIGRWAD